VEELAAEMVTPILVDLFAHTAVRLQSKPSCKATWFAREGPCKANCKAIDLQRASLQINSKSTANQLQIKLRIGLQINCEEAP